MGMSVQEAEAGLKQWQDALAAVSGGSSYSIGGRSLTRQDIDDIRDEIQRWHNTVIAARRAAEGKPQRRLGAQASFPSPGGGSGGLYPDELWRDYRT